MSKRALLVIDVQNEYFHGALPISHPQGHLGNILNVMDAATVAGIPIVVIRHTFEGKPVFRRGTPESL
jgi:nicotinamidase-related amidase